MSALGHKRTSHLRAGCPLLNPKRTCCPKLFVVLVLDECQTRLHHKVLAYFFKGMVSRAWFPQKCSR